MKILFDTNILLDVLLQRRPFYQDAAKRFAKVELGELDGHLSATTLTAIHYLITKTLSNMQARKEVDKLLMLFDIAPIKRNVLASAVRSPIGDYEDAVLHEVARALNLDGLVARNIRDFKKVVLSVYGPGELLRGLELR